MRNKSCLRWSPLLGLLALLILCIAAISIVYFQARARAFNSRPLVLIYSPINHEQARIGDGMIVQAMARSKRGVNRMELWVDDVFVAAQENPAGKPVSPLVFNAAWEPNSLGNHLVLVRAISADGVDGQAAMSIEVIGKGETALSGHIAQEGETFDSIAEQFGVSPEELAELNPGIDPGSIAPGDELIVPGGEDRTEESLTDEDGILGSDLPESESPPLPDDSSPGDFLEVLELIPFLEAWFQEVPASDELLSLRVEALSLETDAAYESLHCYIGIADGLPRWYPDSDNDQTTDESFDLLGDQMWDIGEYLSGEAAPTITWPGNQALSLDATCVGILGGGTEAVELGQLLLEIPPVEWDGIARWSPEANSEGSFTLEYRVSRAMADDHGAQIWLDPSMTPPTNLTLAGTWAGGYSLYWSYQPRSDEEPIDGFRVYLNGTLLWVEPPDARTTALPSQWLFPCVEPYNFTVTAFREGYPDGPESIPSTPPVIIEAEPENCQRVVYVTFLNLTTHDLGGDGRYENRSGDVGPVYGYVYANDQQASFDGRSETWGGLGFSHNSQYDIRDLTHSSNWQGSGPAQFRVELAENEYLEVGFHIDDEDTGSCNDPSDPGCDELVCAGEAMINVDVDTTSDVRTIQSRDGRCDVTYTLGLGAGFPAEDYGGEIPLPWLSVEDLTMTEAGQIRIHVRNTGRASWPSREVKAAITRPSGEIVNVLSWPAISLAPGEVSILQSATINFGDLPVCVILDPDNEVEESGDRFESTGILSSHLPFCMKLPDLAITAVEYDTEGGRLLVTVQNQGEGVLENRTIALSLHPVGGGPALPSMEHPAISLGSWETTVLTMTANESLHSGWFNGYVVTIDPDDLIAESNNDNNSHTVPGGARLRLAWEQIMAPYEARNRVEFDLRAYIVSAGSRRQVADWQITQNIDWSTCGHDLTHGECSKTFAPMSPYDTDWFNITGDEALEINVYVNHEYPVRDEFGHTFTWLAATETYRVMDGLPAGNLDFQRGCTMIQEGTGDHGWVLGRFWDWAPSLGYWHEWLWYVDFNLCREDGGD